MRALEICNLQTERGVSLFRLARGSTHGKLGRSFLGYRERQNVD
jgi:hypothetical protein